MIAPARISRRGFLAGAVGAGVCGLGASGLIDQPAAEARQADPKTAWQIGIYTRPWARWDWRIALDAIAQAGFQYAGLMTTRSKTNLVLSAESSPEEGRLVREECARRGLRVLSVYGGGYPVNPDKLEAGIKALRRLIDNVAAAGCGSLLLGGNANPALQEPYYKIVAECCVYAAEKGVLITLKPHGGLNATGPQCRKCVETVGHKNFRLWYDPGNILFYSDGKLDPVEDAATVDGLVVGMSVKDYQHPRRVDLTPGTGQVDFPRLMTVLKKGGFASGPLVIECLAPGELRATLEEARKARRFVEHLIGY
ncbi:MAG: sugar phosphate isomerase/epimerase family protein [Thermoguttaceae bacterium]